MSHIWTFSSSSETHVQRCLNAAPPPDSSNKWLREFGYKNKKTEDITDLTDTIESDDGSPCHVDIKPVAIGTCSDAKMFSEAIEAEPVLRFDYMVEECLKNQSLIVTLAKNLSGSSIEKIFNCMYSKTNLDTNFIQYFFQYFFPVYLKKEYTWFSLDLLIKGYKTYPIQFRIFLTTLLKDIDLPNKVLQDFVLNLDSSGKSDFMSKVMEMDLTAEEFVHHLFTIYSAYKDCDKTEQLQNFIITLLTDYSQVCTNDRNYGRLLLAYLQAQHQNSLPVNFTNVERIIEMHRSPFKRPCLTVLSELIEQHNAQVIGPRAHIVLRPEI